MIGVLCAEHVGGTRTWTVDEQNFAVSTANLIAVAMADDERRAALARLADSEARSRLIVDTAPDAFIGIDTEGQIVTWNTQAEAIFGWTREEALGRNMADTLIPPAYRDAHLRGMAHFLDTGSAPVVERQDPGGQHVRREQLGNSTRATVLGESAGEDALMRGEPMPPHRSPVTRMSQRRTGSPLAP